MSSYSVVFKRPLVIVQGVYNKLHHRNKTGISYSNKMISQHSRIKPYKNQNILLDLDIKM